MKDVTPADMFKAINDLKKNIRELNINEYYKLQKNCLDFAKKNNFNNFLSKHKNIYKYI